MFEFGGEYLALVYLPDIVISNLLFMTNLVGPILKSSYQK